MLPTAVLNDDWQRRAGEGIRFLRRRAWLDTSDTNSIRYFGPRRARLRAAARPCGCQHDQAAAQQRERRRLRDRCRVHRKALGSDQ